jgi:hypothetical protein
LRWEDPQPHKVAELAILIWRASQSMKLPDVERSLTRI